MSSWVRILGGCRSSSSFRRPFLNRERLRPRRSTVSSSCTSWEFPRCASSSTPSMRADRHIQLQGRPRDPSAPRRRARVAAFLHVTQRLVRERGVAAECVVVAEVPLRAVQRLDRASTEPWFRAASRRAAPFPRHRIAFDLDTIFGSGCTMPLRGVHQLLAAIHAEPPDAATNATPMKSRLANDSSIQCTSSRTSSSGRVPPLFTART